MKTDEYPLSPPSLDELVDVLGPALEANYASSSVSVAQCPDLRQPPYLLAAEGLSGRECIADVGGQPNLFPEPRFDKRFSMLDCARAMGMSQSRGMLIGAGAGPWFQLGTNSELATNLSWQGEYSDVTNKTYYTKVDKHSKALVCEPSLSTECALMVNLYGSSGLSGPVLKIIAKGRTGAEKSFTDCIRHALKKHFGDERPVSMGGIFVIKSGKTKFHVMPDFPPREQLPFITRKELDAWLTYHEFDSSTGSSIVCLTVFHSADPGKKIGLRMEHTHAFTEDGSNRGGHYHYDLDGDEVEYEAYLNTAKAIYRIDKPQVTLERELHD